MKKKLLLPALILGGATALGFIYAAIWTVTGAAWPLSLKLASTGIVTGVVVAFVSVNAL